MRVFPDPKARNTTSLKLRVPPKTEVVCQHINIAVLLCDKSAAKLLHEAAFLGSN